MKLEIDFQGSEILDVKADKTELQIVFSQAVIVSSGSSLDTGVKVPATLKIGMPKFAKLPKKGRLSDGELYGVPGKALNGRIPVDLKCNRDCELSLSFEDKDYTITGKSFQVIVDPACLPKG
jgi:hypothetical protein